ERVCHTLLLVAAPVASPSGASKGVGSSCAVRLDRVAERSVQKRFPLRTLILMVLALASFVWFYWNTHRTPPVRPARPVQEVEVVPFGGDR
ncbi:MAG TPA: hypothetical protein VFB81_07825, partial [Myxococcales bacterium]|nr:hypothetical protein [Myxococcales bacterium]